MDNKTGGPAFPVSTEYGEKVDSSGGMTLLDYFAAKAMQGLIIRYENSEGLSEAAYDVAEAMLAEREKRNG